MILQKVAHEVNHLIMALKKSVVDVSIDFHSKINSKSDIKIFHVIGDFSVDKKIKKITCSFLFGII